MNLPADFGALLAVQFFPLISPDPQMPATSLALNSACSLLRGKALTMLHIRPAELLWTRA